MDLICVCLCHTAMSFPCSLVVACWERADLLALSYVSFSCDFVTFPCGVLGQVWCNGRWACQTELPFTVNLDWSTVNLVKQHRYTLIVQNNCTADDKGGQLYTASMPGKRSQANLNRKPKS